MGRDPWVRQPSGLYLRHEFDLHIGGGAVASPYYPVGADCVLYLPLGDGSDGYGLSDGTDISSYGNNATWVGSTPVALGASCDGIDDQLIVSDHASLDITVVDVLMWIYPTAVAMWDSYIIKSATWVDGWGLYCNTTTPDQKVFFYTQSYTKGQSKGGLQLNTWNLIEGYGQVDSRVPGIDLSYGTENTEVVNPVTYPITNNASIKIGGQSDGGGTFPTCIIGEVLVFNEIKSLEYKTDLRNFTKTRYGVA